MPNLHEYEMQEIKIKNFMITYFEDFSFTSQANHLAKLLNLKKDYEREGFHLQRLYNGVPHSTFWSIVGDNNPWN